MRFSSTQRLARSAAAVAALAGGIVAVAATEASAASCPNNTAVRYIHNNFRAVETAAHHNAPDGRISRNDFRAVANRQNGYPSELRASASRIVNYDGGDLFHALDNASTGGNRDNRVSAADLSAYLRRPGCR